MDTIKVDKNRMTSVLGIFAEGYIVRGGVTVIFAMGDGRDDAQEMHSYTQVEVLVKILI